MDLSWHALNRSKLFVTLKNKDLATPGFAQKKIKMHPLKLAEAQPSFRKVSLPPAKLFSVHF